MLISHITQNHLIAKNSTVLQTHDVGFFFFRTSLVNDAEFFFFEKNFVKMIESEEMTRDSIKSSFNIISPLLLHRYLHSSGL